MKTGISGPCLSQPPCIMPPDDRKPDAAPREFPVTAPGDKRVRVAHVGQKEIGGVKRPIRLGQAA
jgi:hypothetical protein